MGCMVIWLSCCMVVSITNFSVWAKEMLVVKANRIDNIAVVCVLTDDKLIFFIKETIPNELN